MSSAAVVICVLSFYFIINSEPSYGRTTKRILINWLHQKILVYTFLKAGSLPLFVEARVRSLFCYDVLSVLSSFAIILLRQRERVGCLPRLVTFSVLWIFLMVRGLICSV